MKIEHQVRGSKPSQDVFVGEPGQLTVDIDNWDVRLHDGVTPGGRLLINRDNGDERWQAKSVELDGFVFTPEKRGHLTRLGPGVYRIRQFEVDGQQFTLANPAGYEGNPKITLNEIIESDHKFANDLIVGGVLQVDGGINGDLFGDVTGNLTGNVTGNVTGNLTGNANGDHTGSFTGDIDVQGQDFLLDDDSISVTKIAGLEAFIKLHAVPFGVDGSVIVMWSGVEADIPEGWYLCDGLNGTPDLRDKFIIGAGSLDYDPHDSGGQFFHNHETTMATAGSHQHEITTDGHQLTVDELPSHWHGVANHILRNVDLPLEPDCTLAWSNGNDPGEEELELASSGTNIANLGRVGETGGDDPHNHTATSEAAGSHDHELDNVDASSLPPYYALCFIMRGA